MNNEIQVGDRVKVVLDSQFWKSRGGFPGRVARIDPYSAHRRLYWVELDQEVEAAQGGRAPRLSSFYVKLIRKLCSN